MRLFFALGLDASSKLEIEHWRNKVFPRNLKAIPSNNYHITLAFLGETKPAQLDTLCRDVDAYLREATPESITLNLDQCNYWSGPGILWIGPTHWPESLDSLHRRMMATGRITGSAQNKKNYQPHVSIFKSKQPLPKPLIEPSFELCLDELLLFESVRKKNGVNYEALESWQLPSGQVPATDPSDSKRLTRPKRVP